MKLSADKTSYRASGVMVRDARHVHNGPEAPRAVRGKKDRKRWCGGHVGRGHKPVCMDYATTKFAGGRLGGPTYYQGWKILVCTECGKELDHYYPWHVSQTERSRYPKPAWVTP
jgi:hypothetical protein